MGKAHQNQNKPAQPKSETNSLVTQQFSIVSRKQTPIQSSTQTNLDLRHSAMGKSLKFQHQNPPVLPIQDWYINDFRNHEDLQLNTASDT
jgi:hypothetical protein